MEIKTHIALVSIPAFSHQVSILEFAKRLVHLHQDFHVTCIIPTIGSPPSTSIAFLEALPSSIDHIFLPPVNFQDLPQSTPLQVQLQLAVSHSMPSVREALKSLISSSSSPGLVALVADPFAYEALEFSKELNISSYIYFPSSAMLLSLCLHSSKLDKSVSCEFRDFPEPIMIAGCVPVHGVDLPDNLQDRSNLAYKQFLQRCKSYLLADGFIVNSFVEMEGGPIRTLQKESSGINGTVYPVGPIIQTRSNRRVNGSESDCLRWLDKQPPNSVLYVSFGSGGSLSQGQINELALGLELSNQRFLWVNVRAPNDRATAAYLSAENENPSQFLPKGFLERTEGQGLVIPSWAPQIEVLSHNATGGFLTHCGWNSILESIVSGVPLIAWPLFAEQRTNAAMLTDDSLKVAVRPKVNDNGAVEKEEIAKVIKSLMEGEEGKETRRRMNNQKDAAASALMEDGSSTKTLSMLALKWKNLQGT